MAGRSNKRGRDDEDNGFQRRAKRYYTESSAAFLDFLDKFQDAALVSDVVELRREALALFNLHRIEKVTLNETVRNRVRELMLAARLQARAEAMEWNTDHYNTPRDDYLERRPDGRIHLRDFNTKINTEICSLCQESFLPAHAHQFSDLVILQCNHYFHKECFFRIYRQAEVDERCPICRVDMKRFASNINSSSEFSIYNITWNVHQNRWTCTRRPVI